MSGLYRQHSDDLNAFLYHSGGRSRRAGESERHECCERPILAPPQPQPQRGCPPAPPRHGGHSAGTNRHIDPRFATTATLPRPPPPGTSTSIARSQIDSRQQMQEVRHSVSH